MPGFHVEHFGCRAARADGEAVSDHMRAAGLCEHAPSTADLVVVNTCSVTAEADRAARAFIRRVHRRNPEARILVTGCYAQRAPEELAQLAGVAAVVGNSHKALGPHIALGLAGVTPARTQPPCLIPIESLTRASGTASAPIWADEHFAHSFIEETQLVPSGRTRPNLKIQEGCSNRCTFCVIPQTRGSSRSLHPAAILKQLEGFVAAGGKELVLSGINLGRWGRDLDATREPTGLPLTLPSLVRRILSDTALPRLRLSSIEPMDWTSELIELMAIHGGMRLARHAHVPLQSGSDAVLHRMHRRYRPWHYIEKVEALTRSVGLEITIGADLMVGFPGETDGEFQKTVGLVRALPFGYLHLFPFSPRPGTRGWALHAEDPVPRPVVEERMFILRELAAEKALTHRRKFIGRELEAVTLHTPPELEFRNRTVALTENFLPSEVEGRLPANRLVRLRVTGLNQDRTLRALLLSCG